MIGHGLVVTSSLLATGFCEDLSMLAIDFMGGNGPK